MDLEASQALDDLRADLPRVEESLRAEIIESRAEMRRHFEIVTESLRDDIRMIAEGIVALDAKVERLQRPGR